MRSGPYQKKTPPRNTTALQYAVKLLSTRSYSERKLGEKLRGRGFEADESERALERLRSERLIDDRRYAEEFVRARLAIRPRAASVLSRELRQRGIAAKLAQSVAQELAPKESDEQLARELVARKKTMYASLDSITRRRRLAAFLARRGFSYDVIGKVLGRNPEPDPEN